MSPPTSPGPTASATAHRTRLRLAALASLVAAAALGFGLVVPSFWVGQVEGAEYRVGLIRTSICLASGCREAGLGQFGAETWGRLGAASFVAGALAVLAHLVVAAAALGGAGRWYRPRLAGGLGLFAVSLGATFVLGQPGLELEVGPALLAYFLGGAVAVGAGVALYPRRSPGGSGGRSQ